MSSDAFQQLKQNRDKSFSRVKDELLNNRLLPNEHNKSLLRKVLKLAEREDLIDQTLLSNEIWNKHQKMMISRFNKMILRIDKQFKKNASRIINDKNLRTVKLNQDRKLSISSRIRFMTLLHEVVPVDQEEILTSIERLERQIREAFVGQLPSVRIVGAIELEFLNLELLKKASFEHEGKHTGERKRDTLESMLMPIYAHLDHAVLVHLHAVVDLGTSRDAEDVKRRVEQRVRSFPGWSQSHQLQIKALSESFNGRAKTLEQNLADIAAYITKGTNMLIAGKRYYRYKVSFDQNDLGLNQDMYFAAEGSEDVRNMQFKSIAICAELLDKIMAKRRARDGYAILI